MFGLMTKYEDIARVTAADWIQKGELVVQFPDGRVESFKGKLPGLKVDIRIEDNEALRRLVVDGFLGFAEAYLDGHWTSRDLQGFFDFLNFGNDNLLDNYEPNPFIRLVLKFQYWLQGNSRRGAKKNIAHHYDLGNDFYRLWLDESMTYSSALFRTGQESLEKAQMQKYASMVDQLGVVAGEHVLEIGCGWGGFAEYAAGERGLRVTALTISQAQHDFAVQRIARAGLADRVTIKLQDYRDETGIYDGVASIEMFEAVGEKYWPVYFASVLSRLNPGRNATLQIITTKNERFETYRKSVDFIQKYIFPGGMLPSPSALRREVERAGLKVLHSIEFGKSYSLTLRRWHELFNDRWQDVAKLGFDERFRRMWNFYLTSCAGAFEGGNCDVTQITINRPSR